MASNNPIGPFSRGYKTRPTIIVPTPNPSKYNQLLAEYDKLLCIPNKVTTYRGVMYSPEENIQDALRTCKYNPVLTPAEIEEFLFLTQAYESRGGVYSVATGLIATRLLKRSYYNGGHRQFTLDLRGCKPLNRLCYELTVKNDFEIRIRGTVGSEFGDGSLGGRYYLDELGEKGLTGAREGSYYIKKASGEVGAVARDAYFYVGDDGPKIGIG